MKTLWLLPLALTLAAAPKPKTDKGLIGRWGMGGETLYIFNADGSGTAEDAPLRWSSDGKVLTIRGDDEPERVRYRLAGDRLTLRLGSVDMTLERLGAKGAAAKAKKTSPKSRREPTGAGSSELAGLLLSSAWCSFSYRQTSGYSSTKRVAFSPDGSWSAGARGEGYSSGYGGTMASQSDTGERGRWKAQGEQLFMSSSEEPSLSPVEFSVKRNSSGYPIITADGVEYSQCE